MPKFQTKPVIVDAVQFTELMAIGDEPLPIGVRALGRSTGNPPGWEKKTLLYHRHLLATSEGSIPVEIGDWIVTGVNDERELCNAGVFDQIYEPVGVVAPPDGFPEVPLV